MKKMKKIAKMTAKSKQILIDLRLTFTLVVIAIIVATILITLGIMQFLQYAFGISLKVSDVWWIMIFSVLIGGAISAFSSISLFNPIVKLNNAMRKVSEGDFSVRIYTRSSIKEVRDLYKSFNLMVEELSATEVLQTDFITNVSHEIKTPISAIEGYATLLQSGVLDEDERAKCADKILFNTKRLSELVSNVLLLSKIDSQVIQSKCENYRLDEQIRKSVVFLEQKWLEKNIELDIELSEIEFFGNENTMQHVWNNIISNAIKFNSVGGMLKIRLEKELGVISVIIEDSGCGIKEGDENHIFNKFYQSDSSHKEEGNGLGLALVKQIVEMHGGVVSAENRTEGGCRVIVEFFVNDTK